MKIQIESVENGYIITEYEETENNTTIEKKTVIVERNTEAETFRDLVYHVQDLIGHSDSRYDEKRYYGVIAPGDKNDNFTEAHSKVIFGD